MYAQPPGAQQPTCASHGTVCVGEEGIIAGLVYSGVAKYLLGAFDGAGLAAGQSLYLVLQTVDLENTQSESQNFQLQKTIQQCYLLLQVVHQSGISGSLLTPPPLFPLLFPLSLLPPHPPPTPTR